MKKKTKKYESDFFASAKKIVGKERFEKAIDKGNTSAKEISLKMARETLGINQNNVKGLSQPEVSKIEGRKDIKISTLAKYADGLGLKLKISLVSEEDEKSQIAIYG